LSTELHDKCALILCRNYPPVPGGVEKVAEQQVGFLTVQNWSVKVITFHPGSSESVTVAPHGRGIHGEDIFRFPILFTAKSVHFGFRYFLMAFIFCIKYKPQKIFVHHPSPLDALAGSVLSFIFGIDLNVVYHAGIYNKPKLFKLLANPVFNMQFSRARRILYTSRKLMLAEPFGQENSRRVVPIAVSDAVSIRTTGSRGKTGTELRLLFIGRIVPYKGVPILFEALKGVSGVHLNCFGSGPLKKSLEQFAADHQLSVTFHKDLSEEHKIELLENSDALVLPSITPAEAFGVVQLEAMQFGLPVINTDLPTGVPEVAINMVSGLTVKPGSVEELRGAILTLRDDRSLLRQLSKGAAERAKDFSSEKVADEFLKATD
jgi:glycosyltransferase involved in cell wall biosynthesis